MPVEETSQGIANLARPIPSQITIANAEGPDGRKWVQFIISTFTGIYTFFLPPENAQQFAEDVLASAKEAISGLLVPQQGLVVPD